MVLLGCIDEGAVEEAAGALTNLAHGSSARKAKINDLDAAQLLRPLLSHDSLSLAEKAAEALHALGHDIAALE